MTLIERLIILGFLGGGAYMAVSYDVVKWGGNELTIYPVRCLASWGEFQGMPKCKAEDPYTYVLDVEAKEVHIKGQDPEDFIVRKGCRIDSDDYWVCPLQSQTLDPGRPAVLGPILCTVEQLKNGECDIEKNTVQNFGQLTHAIPMLAVVDGLPLRNRDDCVVSRYYANVAQWLAIKGAELIGRISLWPSEPKECTPREF